ncbi:MAG: LacI family DNA-binding transcriptional regulator [Eubacteriales bacterium]|nr:LacI family DNA-binding transcriptional regulator [Eubacteriales bacterium]
MTNKELARHFGVSPTAFSLIVNHKPGVSDETRERISAELERMGYGHLLKKENVKEQNSNLCFVVFKRHGQILDLHPFFLLLMENLEQRARMHGYNMLFTTIDLRLPLNEQIKYLNSMDVKGAVIFATEMHAEDIECFREFQRPYIVLDNDFMSLPVNAVSINNQMGTYQAVEYLVRLGHREIGYLKSISRISSFDEREKGYREALQSFGLELKPEYIFQVCYFEEGSHQDFRQILQKKAKLPTAFVTDDDTIAVGVMKALQEQGYRIPEDISIVGYNDRPTCSVTEPPLTSVNVSRYSFAAEAIDMLVGIVKNEERAKEKLRTKKLRVETKLYVRGSAGRPAGSNPE